MQASGQKCTPHYVLCIFQRVQRTLTTSSKLMQLLMSLINDFFSGCRVIGLTGSDDKVKWLVDVLKFDAAFNYKTTDIAQALKQAAPEGVDCYFDNVSM